jgi:hypothetical protein
LALPDMVAGKIQMVFYPPTFLQFVRDGKLRAITIAAPAVAAPDDGSQPNPSPAAPTPTGLIPPIASVGNVLAQSGNDSVGPLGLPDLSSYSPNLLLGQNVVPSAPGAVDPAVIPNLSAFNAGYLGERLKGALPSAAALQGNRLAGWTIMRRGAIPPIDAVVSYTYQS